MANRKPKKVLIQFAVALIVAVILGVVAVVVGFTIIQGMSKQTEQIKLDLEKQAQEVAAEKRRLKAEQENQENVVKTYKVVQAVADLQPGQPITQEMVTIVTTPERPLPGTLSMVSQALGKMVKSPILHGEPLDTGRLLDAGGYIMVQEGMRAITISVDTIGGLNGALVPGSHVDILTSVKEGEQLVTKTLLQNVQVASIGSNPMSGGRGAPAGGGGSGIPVTLVVNPQQAQKLTLANNLGQFHLTLRNFNDKNSLKLPAEDLTALMTGLNPAGGSMKAGAKSGKRGKESNFHNVSFTPETNNLPNPLDTTPAKSKYTIQIYRGTGTESVDFQQ
jgi:Flp pilus assembly protein CpaB